MMTRVMQAMSVVRGGIDRIEAMLESGTPILDDIEAELYDIECDVRQIRMEVQEAINKEE